MYKQKPTNTKIRVLQKGPHKIQTFTWLTTHERLLTNVKRNKWNNIILAECPYCNHEEETILHVLQDCPYATQTWIKIIPYVCIISFFLGSCNERIFNNFDVLKNLELGKSWTSMFMVSYMYLWTWHYKTIFRKV